MCEHTLTARSDRGIALVVALLVMVLLSALGLSLAIVASTEERVASSYRDGSEAFYAADAAFERVVQELTSVPDWSLVLDGSLTSAFADGAPGPRVLPDGSTLNLGQATASVNCGKPTCSATDLATVTPDRPWGANNPQWRLYAHGRLAALSPSGGAGSNTYVVVWVGDDPLENDGQPLIDGDTTLGANPGRGLVQVLTHAYGPSGVRRAVEGTLRRAGMRVHVLSWRELRR